MGAVTALFLIPKCLELDAFIVVLLVLSFIAKYICVVNVLRRRRQSELHSFSVQIVKSALAVFGLFNRRKVL